MYKGQYVANIRKVNLPQLREHITKLCARAEKLGVDGPVLNEHGEFVRDEEDNFGRVHKVTRVRITVDNPVFAYEGWRLLAVLDHSLAVGEDGTPDDVIVFHDPRADTDESFAHLSDPICTHCGVKRYRVRTFVIRHEDGRTMQVGTTCLKDFLGWTVKLYNTVLAFDIDDEWTPGKPSPYVELDRFLNVAASFIRVDGWRSRSKYGMGYATVDDTITRLFDKNAHHKLKDKYKVTDDDRALAAKSIEWAAGLESIDNDYLHNLHIIAKSGMVHVNRTAGLAASIPFAFARQMEQEAKRKESQEVSDWIGTPKERFKGLDVTYVDCKVFDSYYGARWLHRFETDAGDVIVWWTNDGITFEGTHVTHHERPRLVIDATVKEHDMYRDVKQTAVLRVAVKAVRLQPAA